MTDASSFTPRRATLQGYLVLLVGLLAVVDGAVAALDGGASLADAAGVVVGLFGVVAGVYSWVAPERIPRGTESAPRYLSLLAAVVTVAFVAAVGSLF